MVQAIEGSYRNGRIELSRAPESPGPSRVVVVFLPDSLAPDRRAAEQLLEEMRTPYHLGGKPYADRGELHDRADRA